MTWQPMESAPKGELIIIWEPDLGLSSQAYWYEAENRWVSLTDPEEITHPSLWQPWPEAPVA